MKKITLPILIFVILLSLGVGFAIAQIINVTIGGIYGNATSKLNWTAVNISDLTSKDIWKRLIEGTIYEIKFEGNVLDAEKDWAILEDNKYAINVRVPFMPEGKEFYNLSNLIGKRVEVEGVAMLTWSGYILVFADKATILGNATPSNPIILKLHHLQQAKNNPESVLGRYVLGRNQNLTNIVSDSPQILNFTYSNISYLVYSPHYTFNVTEGNRYNITGFVTWYFGPEIYATNLTG